MRSLSKEEVAALRWRPAPGEKIPDDIRALADGLLARGVVRREVVRVGEKLFERWLITSLGRLALRVALLSSAGEVLDRLCSMYRAHGWTAEIQTGDQRDPGPWIRFNVASPPRSYPGR